MRLMAGVTPYSDWHELQALFGEIGLETWKKNELEQLCTRLYADQRPDPVSNDTFAANRDAAALFEGMPELSVLATDSKEFLLTLEYWLHAFEDTHLMLFHTQPQGALAKALVREQDLAEAQDVWRSAAEQILACYRHNRRKVTLIDIEGASHNPRTFLGICQEFLAIPSTAVPSAVDDRAIVPEIYRLIGSQFAGQSDALVELSHELAASSRPLGTTSDLNRIDWRAAYSEYRVMQEQAARVEELEKENELMLLQLHQVQEELEEYYLQVQSLTNERDTLAAEMHARTQDLQAIRQSISWKITAPLRKLVAPIVEVRRKRDSKISAETE